MIDPGDQNVHREKDERCPETLDMLDGLHARQSRMVQAGCFDFLINWDPDKYTGEVCSLCGKPTKLHNREGSR